MGPQSDALAFGMEGPGPFLCFGRGRLTSINAASHSVGKNTYNYYRIHKDDKHVMFYDNTGKACRTIYYTVPVSYRCSHHGVI